MKSEVFAYVYPAIHEQHNFMYSSLDDIRTLSPYRPNEHDAQRVGRYLQSRFYHFHISYYLQNWGKSFFSVLTIFVNLIFL